MTFPRMFIVVGAVMSSLAVGLPPRVFAAEAPPSIAASPGTPSGPIWTTTPVRIDRSRDTRERLPMRQGAGHGSRRLVVDPFPQLDAEAGFSAEGRRWRIAHVELPERTRSCPFENGRRWPCGVRAWAFVSGLLAGARLACEPPNRPQDAAPTIDCRLEDKSIAENILEAGWAEPGREAPPHLVELHRRAVSAHRGLHALGPPP